MIDIAKVNKYTEQLAKVINTKNTLKGSKRYFAGVDLGTAYMVIAVVDENGNPAAGALRYAEVVRDGLVVDYVGAVRIVKELKGEIEENLDCELEVAAVAYPPGTGSRDASAFMYVTEGAGFECVRVLEEPVAANMVLGVENGAIVDIGGGTTGIAILKNGKVVYTADEPTGGTHFSLVIAGAYNIPFLQAEERKKDLSLQKELFPIVKPVMEKVSIIIERHISGYEIEEIYLCGGTSAFAGIERVISERTGLRVIKTTYPWLVTPLGIALACREEILNADERDD
ncbi:MAG: ethanolamine utilization protein EutJ [Thermacetogeniaceae bacterium]